MKATGIVRRIDDLGRVVIPKEIRRTLRIREGDPLEIFTKSDGEVIFKKYSPMGELALFSIQLCDTLFKITGLATAICDRDVITAVAGQAKKEMSEKNISAEVESMMEARKTYRAEIGSVLFAPTSSDTIYRVIVGVPIIAAGDVSGCVLFMKKQDEERINASDTEIKLASAAAGFLGRQLEA